MNNNRNNYIIVVDGKKESYRKQNLRGEHLTDKPNIFKAREGVPKQMILINNISSNSMCLCDKIISRDYSKHEDL